MTGAGETSVNLEEIEQRCLKYLMESGNPFVPVDTLLRFLQRRDEFPGLDEAELIRFLRHHELFHVVDPLPLTDDPGAVRELEQAGFLPRPRVVLVTRIPSARDVKTGMLEELGRMLEALSAALDEARLQRDRDKARTLRTLIRRAEVLAERIEAMNE